MIYGLWHSAAGLQAQQYRQAIIANNLANAETPGFKPERIAFQERLSASMSSKALGTHHPVLDGMTGGLFETRVYTDFRTDVNRLIPSSSAFDVAIEGGGFLTVQTSEGQRYTRDGRLIMDREGALRHVASGGAILDTQGQAIILDPSSTEKVRIDEAGNVRQGENIVGQLGLVDFADRQQLEKIGQDLYAADRAQAIGANGRIKQFSYEASGVEPVQALVEMIAAARAYELNAKMITMQDDTVGTLISQVGRIG